MADGGAFGTAIWRRWRVAHGSCAPQIEVAAFDQGRRFCGRRRSASSIQKPQSGWTQPTRPAAQTASGAFDASGDFLGRLDVVDLHVDHADAEPDARIDIAAAPPDRLAGRWAISRTR